MHTEFETGVATATRSWPPRRVRVHAPGRLHLGFLDPAGSLGRRFGSLGLVVDGPETVVDVARAPADSFECLPGGEAALERARSHVETLRRATGCRSPLALRLVATLPAHAGLGSGTQLALAVGRAFCAAFDIPVTTPQLAFALGRGQRSGVGVAGFDLGGLLVDGGPREDGSPAALLARIALPEAWRVLLVLDPRCSGLSGPAEKTALACLAPLPRAAAAEICHETLMRVLPGAAGAEFVPFAGGLTRIQQLLGDHFAPAQEGRAFASPAVGRLLQWVGRSTQAGVGQSSWGPTGFAFLPSEAQAHAVLAAARAAGVVDPALDLQVIRARNHGAIVSDQRAGG